MADEQRLVDARKMAAGNLARFPNESAEYRAARNELLAAEIELRRHLERVAAQRRALPPGGEVPRDYEFVSAAGPVRLSDLFAAGKFSGVAGSGAGGGEKDTLMLYNMMFGPARPGPCPSCTSFLNAWNGTAMNLRDRVALAVVARSPIARLVEYQRARGLGNLPFVSDASGEYTRAYVSAEDTDVPGFNVFVRRGGKILHYYSGEMSGAMADPGQDPRGAPELDPLWVMLDFTPEGRGRDWYPKLKY
jgi:predicted dithiol-disulfide oxidoreductase (DUF899 family)